MASSKHSISPRSLREAFLRDLRDVWTYARSTHADHKPYAFVLRGDGYIPHLTPYILTEESLDVVARKNLDLGMYDNIEEARKGTRFSVYATPRLGEFQNGLPTVDRLFEPHAEHLEEKKAYRMLARAAISAFKSLDAEGLFGAGDEREGLLLLVTTSEGDGNWTKESAKQLNSSQASRELLKSGETEGPYRACGCFDIEPDGSSLYSYVTSDNPNRTSTRDEFIYHLIRYRISARSLYQESVIAIGGFGDTIRAVSAHRNGLLALRITYRDGRPVTSLLQFDRNLEILAEVVIAGEPHGFVQSNNGDRIAVTTQDRRLWIFDHQFTLIAEHTFVERVSGLRYLRSGVLLLGGDSSIHSLDSTMGEPKLVANHPGFHLVTDRNEMLLVAASYKLLQREQDQEFGMALLSLPTFEFLREIRIPGHQLVNPAISDDGNWLALECHQLGTFRKRIVVFDTRTGALTSQRKYGGYGVLKFMPDNKTLVISKSGYMAGEPIDFWEFRNG